MVDEKRLNALIQQLPITYGLVENLTAKLGISIKGPNLNIEPKSFAELTTIKKIRRLESYLRRNNIINYNRPRRMPHNNLGESSYWWVKESFLARKIIIPTPELLKKFGVLALTVWVSDPKPAPKPRHPHDWTGSFLYLPTVQFDSGSTFAAVSGCSALQFIVNVAKDKPLLNRDWKEPFGRGNRQHPIQKLADLGAFVSDERRLESLYFVRYITDEQVYVSNGAPVRTNDLVGYPIYISAYPPLRRARSIRTSFPESPNMNDFFYGDAQSLPPK
jgi:hypothetical protein